MAKYKHKPTIVEAWKVGSAGLIPSWIISAGVSPRNEEGEYFWDVVVKHNNECFNFVMFPGEYIVKDPVKGVFVDYDHTFEQYYEPVKEN